MKISVIIPTHNRQETLIRCLDSVMTQSVAVDEVIVIDDGSDDQSAELIRTVYPSVIYQYQAQQGVSAARNAGICLAQYDWLAFLDSDDEWLPEKIRQQKQAIADTQLRICHTEEIWIRNGVRVNAMNKHRKHGGDIYADSLRMCAMSPSSVLLHCSLLQALGGFDENFVVCEDYDLWLRIAANELVAFVAEPMIRKYGGHDDQLSRRYFGMDRYRIMAIEALLKSETLSAERQLLALEQLRKKLAILHRGALKHANVELIEFCERYLHWGKSD